MKRFAVLFALLFLIGCVPPNDDPSATDADTDAGVGADTDAPPSQSKQITRERAFAIAHEVDSQVTWQISFDDAYEYEFNGEKSKREVWVAQTLSPAANVTLWIDANTGGVLVVRQSEAPAPLGGRTPISAFSFADAVHGWMAVGDLLLATDDGGRTWNPIYDTDTQHQVYQVQRYSVQIGWYSSGEGLFQTEDHGETWERLIDESLLYGRFQFTDRRHGWLRLFHTGLQRTQDRGAAWTAVNNPCKQGGLFSFISPTTGWIVCATGGGAGIETKELFRTEDGASTWQLVAQTGPLGGPGGNMPLSSYGRNLFFLDAAHGWLSSAKGDLLVTRDGGRTWEALPRLGDLTEIVQVQFLSPDRGFIIATKQFEGISSLLSTDDGGFTWTELYHQSWPEK